MTGLAITFPVTSMESTSPSIIQKGSLSNSPMENPFSFNSDIAENTCFTDVVPKDGKRNKSTARDCQRSAVECLIEDKSLNTGEKEDENKIHHLYLFIPL